MSNKKPPHNVGRTVADFLAELEANNTTLASWARDKGMCMQTTYMVARGRSTGRHGKSRDVLMAMGVKPPPMFNAVRRTPIVNGRQVKAAA